MKSAERRESIVPTLEIYCPLCGVVIGTAVSDLEAVKKKRLHQQNTDGAHATYLMVIREIPRSTRLI